MNITREQAQTIAERAIAQIIQTSPHLTNFLFTPVGWQRETDFYWVFAAACPELMRQGFVPGAVFACIDKQDGHVWSDEEFERLAEEYERHQFSQPDKAAA